jgi:predicted O-methyltransferase YrrM
MSTLAEMLSSQIAYTSEGKVVELHSGLGLQATKKLTELARDATRTLEIGMAMGCSTLAILEGSRGLHTSIDPNQTSRRKDGWNGTGLESVRRAGYADRFNLIEEPSYSALPKLLEQGERFDLILIDGWHSFDYTFVDYFYSDLLLNDNGVLIIDDWGMPQVHFVTRFIETHKNYVRLGPQEMSAPLSLKSKLTKKDTEDSEWGSICAYRKIQTTQVGWHFFESDFYPHFKLYKWWMKIRSLPIGKPY